MKNIYKILCFCFLILFMISNIETKTAYASFTDIGDIADGFMFDEDSDTGEGMKIKGTEDSDNEANFWNHLYEKYRFVIIAISGGMTLLFIILLIICLIKYNLAVGNAHERKNIITAMLWIIGAIALFGGTTLIMGVSFNLFKNVSSSDITSTPIPTPTP